MRMASRYARTSPRTLPMRTHPLCLDSVMSKSLMLASSVCLALLAGCAASDEHDTESDDAKGHPACSTVWVANSRLPAGYTGCSENGKFEELAMLVCNGGSGDLVLHREEAWALGNGPIRFASSAEGLEADVRYKADRDNCAG